MEGSLLDSQLNKQLSEKPNPEIQAAKKGKSFLKTVKVVDCGGVKQQKNGGPPSDSWSWRKYGQKPIKGSPYPRGYYRCSTSKGCPAKKQVERCRTDASMLIITYTSTHNHPGLDLDRSTSQNSHIQKLTTVSSLGAVSLKPKLQQSELKEQTQNSTEKEETGMAIEAHFHYLEPPLEVTTHIDQNQFSLDFDNPHESLRVLFDEEPISFNPMQTISPKPESNEYDFFDELEELPLSSLPFRSFMTNSSYGGILIQPS